MERKYGRGGKSRLSRSQKKIFRESANTYKRTRFRVYKYVGEEVKRKQRFGREYRSEHELLYITIHYGFCCITTNNKVQILQ